MPTTYAIPNGATVMTATLYTGNGATQNVTNSTNGTIGFNPDFTWYKSRSNASWNHGLFDSVRGTTKQLFSNTTGAEGTYSGVTAFNSNGFSVGSDNGGNQSGGSMVAWQWNAGSGSNTTNTSGTITSTVSANTTAGFSIVTYTGTGANATVGHGLSVAPKLVICKARNSASWNWLVNIGAFTGTEGNYVYLNSTQETLPSPNVKNPTSTVLPLVTSPENNGNGLTFVSYCWAEVDGFSKFGTYTGNGSTNGPFIYTGFRPKFVMTKKTSAAGSWWIQDTSRAPYNAANALLFPDMTNAEYTTAGVEMDILSNGFKLRNSNIDENTNGATYIYVAFAENPFKYANAR